MRFRLMAIILGLGTGWLAGHRSGPRGPEHEGAAPSQQAGRQLADRGGGGELSVRNEHEATPRREAATAPSVRTTTVRQLVERLRGARAEDFATIWEETLAENQSTREQMAIVLGSADITYLIMGEWVNRDPAGAWQYLQSPAGESPIGSGRAVEAMMSAWLAIDPAAALEKFAASNWDELDGGLRRALTKHDPKLALARWQAGADPGGAVPRSILRSLARVDPHAAFDSLVLGEGQHPDRFALSSVINGWPAERLDELLPRLASHHAKFPSTDLKSSYYDIGSALALDGNFHHGLDWILAQSDLDARAKILHGMLRRQQPIDAQALAKIAALPHDELMEFGNFKDILSANTPDPRATWDWIQALDPEVQDRALSAGGITEFARRWALIDPASAFEMLSQIPTDSAGARSELIAGLARASGERHPQAGLELASRLPKEARLEFAETLSKSWSGFDPEAFLDHLESLPDGPEREAHQRGGFKAIAAEDPALAGDLVLDLFDPEQVSERAGELVGLWAVRDRRAAADWVAQLPDEIHESAAGDLGDALIETSPYEAGDAYLSIRDPEARLDAFKKHVGYLAGLDREAARELVRAQAVEIDEEARQQMMEAIDTTPESQ